MLNTLQNNHQYYNNQPQYYNNQTNYAQVPYSIQPQWTNNSDQFIQTSPVTVALNSSSSIYPNSQDIFSINNTNPNLYYSSIPNITNQNTTDYCPWVTDHELKMALNSLAEIIHTPDDIAYLNSIGINPPFNSGKEAINFLVQNKIKVEFGDMDSPIAHAQYSNDQNKIIINKNYKGKMTSAMAMAIADAAYHEIGHAKDKDSYSSVQEELDCLSLNVLGYRYQQRYYPQIINSQQNSKLISDGVALYPKLFFDPDPNKTALVNRVKEKYGSLPMTSPNHDLINKPIALKVKEQA